MAEYKDGERLRVTDASISGGYFKPDQVVMVRDSTVAEGFGPVVALHGHSGVWTIDQFEKVEEPVNCIVTNTPRAGETPEQIAVRMALRDIPCTHEGNAGYTTSRQELEKRARGSDLFPATETSVRTFGTGATRDLDANKLDYEGFLSPLVLKRYAEHMHKARKMSDGSVRASDNWQLGIPKEAYIKSMWRHFYDVWSTHRGFGQRDNEALETELCALLFNVNGYLHEHLKAKRALSADL